MIALMKTVFALVFFVVSTGTCTAQDPIIWSSTSPDNRHGVFAVSSERANAGSSSLDRALVVTVVNFENREFMEIETPILHDRHSQIFPYYWMDNHRIRIGEAGDYSTSVDFFDLVIDGGALKVENRGVHHGYLIADKGTFIVSQGFNAGLFELFITDKESGKNFYSLGGQQHLFCIDDYEIESDAETETIYLTSSTSEVSDLWEQLSFDERELFRCLGHRDAGTEDFKESIAILDTEKGVFRLVD